MRMLEGIPFSEGLVRHHERILAWRPGLLFQSPPEPLSAPEETYPFRWSPRSELAAPAEVNPGVGLGNGVIFDEQLEVAVVFLVVSISPGHR